MRINTRSLLRCALIGAMATLVCEGALAQQQKCFPSKFGPKDEVGNLN